MTPLEEIPALYNAFRGRWEDRDRRMRTMDAAVRGEWVAFDPSDDKVENRSPNLIQVALEDTAESASIIPSVRVTPSRPNEEAKKKAAAMEKRCAMYLDLSKIEVRQIETLMNLVGFGFFPWVVQYDPECQSPVVTLRDPRTCYPEVGWKPGDPVRACMFARELYVRQLPEEYRLKVEEQIAGLKFNRNLANVVDRKVVVVEFFEEESTQVVAMYDPGVRQVNASISWHPILLERVDNPGGICPVVVGQRVSLDSEPRGQFDQVVDVLLGHIRLMSMALDYADQAVYSDVWVKDLVGQMAFGGGAYIQLGPQGAIGRVPPAVTSLSVFEQLEMLVNNVHLGGRWPKSRPGEIDQAIASAKFIEASAGVMNTVIRTLHLIMKRSLEEALRIALTADRALGPDRTIAGTLRNHQFLEEGRKADIDLGARVRVEYGLGLGRDPAQAMVLGIQASQSGFVSREYVQENFEGITDVERERRRIDVQQLKDMAMARLLEGLQAKEIPEKALVEIAREREKGTDIFTLFDKFVVKPAEEQQAQMLPSGLGDPLMPGPDPMAAMGGPTPPPPEELMAGLMGGGPEPSGASRLNVPLGDGSFINAQTGM